MLHPAMAQFGSRQVLQCLQQMLQAKYQNLRSGWRTMFATFSASSKVPTERVANYAFELVTLVYRSHFALVVRYGSFADLTRCITDFCQVNKFQKISLQAIEMVRGLVPKMLECPECLLPQPADAEADANGKEGTRGEVSTRSGGTEEPMVKYWLPVLHSFYEIIMTGEDLEVRRLSVMSRFLLNRFGGLRTERLTVCLTRSRRTDLVSPRHSGTSSRLKSSSRSLRS